MHCSWFFDCHKTYRHMVWQDIIMACRHVVWQFVDSYDNLRMSMHVHTVDTRSSFSAHIGHMGTRSTISICTACVQKPIHKKNS